MGLLEVPLSRSTLYFTKLQPRESLFSCKKNLEIILDYNQLAMSIKMSEGYFSLTALSTVNFSTHQLKLRNAETRRHSYSQAICLLLELSISVSHKTCLNLPWWFGLPLKNRYESSQGLLDTRTDFLPKEIAKIRPKTRFNTNKSGIAKIPCVI